MTTPIDPLKSGNAYFNDPESGGEMVRLLEQDRLTTRFCDRPVICFH